MLARLRSLLVLGLLLVPALAYAQPRREFWGVDAEFVPNWTTPSAFKFLFDADSVDFAGTDFRVGFVRGAILRGDWGVAYVHRTLSDDSLVVRRQGRDCPTCGSFLPGRGTTLDGVEIHKFAALGLIRQRVQLGANVAAGVGKAKGSVTQTTVSPQGATTSSQQSSLEASSLMSLGDHNLKVVPLFRLEFVGTALLAPDLKLRVATGLDLPGYQKVSVGVVYFIGAR